MKPLMSVAALERIRLDPAASSAVFLEYEKQIRMRAAWVLRHSRPRLTEHSLDDVSQMICLRILAACRSYRYVCPACRDINGSLCVYHATQAALDRHGRRAHGRPLAPAVALDRYVDYQIGVHLGDHVSRHQPEITVDVEAERWTVPPIEPAYDRVLAERAIAAYLPAQYQPEWQLLWTGIKRPTDRNKTVLVARAIMSAVDRGELRV